MKRKRLASVLAAALALACGATQPARTAAAKPRAPAARRAPPAAVIGQATIDRIKLKWEAAVGGYGRAVAVDEKLGLVAVANKTEAQVYDLRTGKKQPGSRRCAEEVIHTGLAFVGKHLLLVCKTQVLAFDARSLKPVPTSISAHESPITAATFGTGQLALGHRDGVVRIYDLAGGQTQQIPVPGPPIDVKSLALSPNGKRVAVAWVQGSIWWWEIAQPATAHKVVRHERESDALRFDAQGQVLAEEGAPARTTLWRLEEPPKETGQLENGDWIKRILFTPDQKYLVRGGSDGLELAQIGGAKRIVLDRRGKVEDIALDGRGSALAAVDRDGRLSLWMVSY